MMTKTTLSDVRRTRPRFAAPTPTPPKFLIGTIEQSENHSTPSKQTTNANPNGHKSRFSRPPWPIAASPCRTHLPRPPWRIALPRISRPSSRPLPLAQPHPRRRLRINQSFDVTPLELIHPRNLDSPQRTRPPRPASPSGIAISKISRPSSALLPFAQPDPRNAVTPLPAAFSYCWPPAGVFEVLATLRPWSGLVPFAQAHPRKLSGLSQSLNFTPFAQPQPRKKTSGRGFRAFRVPTLPSGIPSVKDRKTSSLPFALLHPRELLVSSVLQSNVGTSYTSLPLALVHPRNKQSARARSAETSKTPARCRRYENPLLIATPRLEIAATTSKSNTTQNSNRYKMRVLHPPWRMSVLLPPQTDALRRSANAASAPHLKTLIANARLEFNLSHSKENPLQISNRERMAVSQSRFRAPAQKGRWSTIRASKLKLRFESRYSSFQLRASSLQNLIANLELEFGLTHTKLSPLRISNRKYFAVFHSDLLHRREKSGRPTTSDRAVVATAAYAAEAGGD